MFELLENVNILTPEEDAFMENYSTGWECNYDDACDALLYTLIENEQNFNAIMQATMVQEANYFIENGVEMVYEAVDFKAFFGKIKEAVMKAWEKIKAIYLKGKRNIQKLCTDFQAHYLYKHIAEIEKIYNDKSCSRVAELDGYKTLTDEENLQSTVLFKKLQHAANMIDDGSIDKVIDGSYDSAELETLIFALATDNKASTKEEYIKYAKETLGIDKKEKIKIKINDLLDSHGVFKMGTKSASYCVEDAYNKTKQLFKYLSKKCDEGAKQYEKMVDKNEAKLIEKRRHVFSYIMNECITITNIAFNLTCKADMIRFQQSIKACKKIIEGAYNRDEL